jgi:hypothetical protein
MRVLYGYLGSGQSDAEAAFGASSGPCFRQRCSLFATGLSLLAIRGFRHQPMEQEVLSDLWRDAYLLELLRTDRSSIIPLLHEWEEHSVSAMKLERYWHRTPFLAESVSSF